MKDAEIMRQNARFRSSWDSEPGGDLITLTVGGVSLSESLVPL